MFPLKLNRTWVILAIVGIVLYFSVSIISGLMDNEPMEEGFAKLAVNKEDAQRAAVHFASERLSGFTLLSNEPVVYLSDKTASGYLKRNGLTKQYKEQLEAKYPLDYWLVEMKEPASGNRAYINVSMQSPTVVGWRLDHNIDQRFEAGSRIVAENFLIEAGYSLTDFSYRQPPAGTSQPHRFVSKSAIIGESSLLLEVGTSENDIVSFQPSLIVPDSYKQWENRQHTSATWMSIGSLALSFIMGLVAFIYTILRRKSLAFSRGLVLSLLFAAIYFLYIFSSVPAVKAELGGELPVYLEIINMVFSLGNVTLIAVSLYLSLLSGDQLWREQGWNCWPRWRENFFGREIWFAMGRGYLICLFILGVQQALLFLAVETFDSFAINDPSQSVYNLLWPGLFPLLAWAAGISEEILYRMFGIVIFKKLLRNTFLAVLVPSLIWALGHTGYAIYPSYTRLVEVALLGIIFGYVFLKYGLYTAIFAHVALDSILMGLSLIVSFSTLGYILLGLFYIVLPAVVGYVIYLFHGLFVRSKRIQDRLS